MSINPGFNKPKSRQEFKQEKLQQLRTNGGNNLNLSPPSSVVTSPNNASALQFNFGKLNSPLQTPPLLSDFFMLGPEDTPPEVRLAAYYNHFSQVFQLHSFHDYFNLHKRPHCRNASKSNASEFCSSKNPCFPLTPGVLAIAGKKFGELLLQHQSNNKPNENRRLICATCWCPLAQYNPELFVNQQHPQTFAVWWENPENCGISQNVGKILCRCCLELRQSCESETQARQQVLVYFRRNGVVPRNKASKRPNHQPFHFQQIDDIPTLRVPKERVGTKRQFSLTWLQQRGLVCFPFPAQLGGQLDSNWFNEFQQDHQMLYNKPLGQTNNVAANAKNAKGGKRNQVVANEDPSQVAFLNLPLHIPNADTNSNNGDQSMDLSDHSMSNGVPQRPLKKEKTQVQKMQEEQKHSLECMQKLHKVENKPQCYVCFWIPIDIRPEQKGLDTWNLTARDPTKPCSNTNYLVVNQFCHDLEKKFGLIPFLQWAMQVFPWAPCNEGFERFQVDRFAKYNYELFHKEALKHDPGFQADINQEAQGVANTQDIQQTLDAYKQMCERHKLLNDRCKEMKEGLKTLKVEMTQTDEQIEDYRNTKLTQAVNKIEQNTQFGLEILKQNNLQVVTKLKKTNAVRNFGALTRSDQQAWLAELLLQAGIVAPNDSRLKPLCEVIVNQINDVGILQQKFPPSFSQVTSIDLITDGSTGKKPRKTAQDLRDELKVRNNWDIWRGGSASNSDAPMISLESDQLMHQG